MEFVADYKNIVVSYSGSQYSKKFEPAYDCPISSMKNPTLIDIDKLQFDLYGVKRIFSEITRGKIIHSINAIFVNEDNTMSFEKYPAKKFKYDRYLLDFNKDNVIISDDMNRSNMCIFYDATGKIIGSSETYRKENVGISAHGDKTQAKGGVLNDVKFALGTGNLNYIGIGYVYMDTIKKISQTSSTAFEKLYLTIDSFSNLNRQIIKDVSNNIDMKLLGDICIEMNNVEKVLDDFRSQLMIFESAVDVTKK